MSDQLIGVWVPCCRLTGCMEHGVSKVLHGKGLMTMLRSMKPSALSGEMICIFWLIGNGRSIKNFNGDRCVDSGPWDQKEAFRSSVMISL